MISKRVIALALLCLISTHAFGLELSRCFSDNMVLQQKKSIKIWGTAKKGSTVTVAFAGQKKSAKADESGKWSVTLDSLKANSEAQKLTVHATADTQTLTLKNVVVGDVFLFARQSSIDVTLGAKPEGKKLAEGFLPNEKLRFMRVVTSPAKAPQDNLSSKATSGWTVMNKQSVFNLSSAAFHMANELAEKVDVPLGIIDLDMGYHFASSWLGERGVKLALSRKADCNALAGFVANLPKEIEKWEKPKKNETRVGFSPIEMPTAPFVCYNAVIHPMRGIALKGMLLQLGNDYTMVAYTKLREKGLFKERAALDTAYEQSYKTYKYGVRISPQTVPVVPNELRRSLGEETLPIGWIIPPGSDFHDYAIHNREMRELQRRTQLETRNLDLIMPGTEHVPMSGQPADEALLARRCSQWVIGTFYDKKVTASGPIFNRIDYNAEKAEGTIFFNAGTAAGLTAKGDALKRFEVASADGAFVPCKARIDGSTIKLDGTDLPAITFVRYSWGKKPAQGLVNSAGLPAIPFNNYSNWMFDWWPNSEPVKLPMEYHTVAGDWPNRDIAIFNGANKLARGSTQHNPNTLGPTGIMAAPFGPNFYVHAILPESPAEGHVFTDDIIYGVNGKDFDAKHSSDNSYNFKDLKINLHDKYRQFAAAISHSESHAAGGAMSLKIRRKGKNIEVPIQLDVMGSYSATTPWHCAKSRNIVAKAEAWISDQMRPALGLPRSPSSEGFPYHANMLFLLASGNPRHVGLVRRNVYQLMAKLEPHLRKLDPNKEVEPGGSNWWLAYNSLFFGEYYHRTGDKRVLPYLKYVTDKITRHQYRPPGADLTKYAVAKFGERTGGWYSGWTRLPGYGRLDYGMMSAAGMVCTMGLKLAKDAGLEISEESLQRGIRHFNEKRAEYAHIPYGITRLEGPAPVDPVAEAIGKTDSMNGKLGTGAALFTVVDNEGAYKDTVEICSRRCVFAFNNTRHGHGGMFFNNFWTPIGAHLSGEKGYKHFIRGQTWWRELYRLPDGSFSQVGNGGIGVGYALHRVAHHQRLRILGAPRSAFSSNPPAYLKPALAAHARREYALAEELIQKELRERVIAGEELRTVKHFLESMQILRKGIAFDLDYAEGLLKQKDFYLASLELHQLKGVVNPSNARLLAISKAVEAADLKASAKIRKEAA